MRYTMASTAAIGKRVRVFVDGNVVDHCLECDTKRGFAYYLAKDKRTGKLKLNRRRDKLVIKRRKGRVTVEVLDD